MELKRLYEELLNVKPAIVAAGRRDLSLKGVR